MAVLLTLDASVFVAACQPHEPGFTASLTLLDAMLDVSVPLVEPAILPVEVGAALCRAGRDGAFSLRYAEAIFALPNLTLLATEERSARRALAVATQCRLRGADALYVAAAAQYGARLVTLDAEQLQRAPASVGACKPDAAVSLLFTRASRPRRG
jgi:predicted nucleic acid-binding protein